jgi:predicted negative regulator of RcsB-dependent stress response
LRAVVRIISATTPEEARELIEKHAVNDLVIPNWDPYMDEFAKMGEGEVEGTFLERLNKWELPPWLRPVPYLLPSIPGFDERSVTILNVVDDQKDAVAASRLVEYFVDMGERDLAASSASNLRKFPGSPSAALAEAELTAAFGNKADAERALELLTRRTSAGADRSLPWDQKVRLAIVWARNRRIEAARRELQQSLAEIDEARLRLLSTKTLVRFHLLRTALDLEINDAALRSVEKRLLPWDAQVQPVH